MKTFIHLSSAHCYPLPVIFQDDDVRYAESLVEYFLEQYTQKGDVVFDPFAGYGTRHVDISRGIYCPPVTLCMIRRQCGDLGRASFHWFCLVSILRGSLFLQ